MPSERRPAVVLDSFQVHDAPELVSVDQDPEHRRRFPFPDGFVPSLKHSQSVIARWQEEGNAGTRLVYAVRDAMTGELLGGCELLPLDAETANLFYWTHPSHRSRGVASAAVQQVCAIAFQELGLTRLEVYADTDNLASHHVVRRNGFLDAGIRGGRAFFVREVRET